MMIELNVLFSAPGVMLLIAGATWLLSLVLRDVSIVDSVWSLFFLAATIVFVQLSAESGTRAELVLVLVGLWSIRLAAYLTWRNWGEPEDRRYAAMREKHGSGFALEEPADYFLAAGRAGLDHRVPAVSRCEPDPGRSASLTTWAQRSCSSASASRPCPTCSWPASRPVTRTRARCSIRVCGATPGTRTTFGDFCVWWGLYLIAASAGGWWTIFSPLLMSVLLLKVSGVTLLEKDIAERRPAYADYVARTNAFFPGPPQRATADSKQTTSEVTQ